MKPTLLLIFMITSLSLSAQDEEVQRAAQSACSCLKEIKPDEMTEREVKLTLLGCITEQVDVVAEELQKKSMWADSSAFYYMGQIGKAARTLCPQEYERLKKKEVAVDPAILKIDAKDETVAAYSKAVCRCVEITKDVDDCMKRVGSANEEELQKRIGTDNMMAMIMQIAMDAMFDLADHCDAAASNKTIAELKKIPALKDGCNKIALGEFSTETMLGETRSVFTANNLKESSDGKLTAEYELKWNNCSVTLKCLSSTSSMVKKGDVSTLEIRRGSADGFIAMVSFGKMKVPVNYKRVK